MFNDKTEFIKTQLETLPKYKHLHNRTATMVCCPWHGDKTPSLRVSHYGRFKCYGCPATGTYDELAEALGLELYQRDPMRPARVITTRVVRQQEELVECDFSLLDHYYIKSLPPNKLWRGITTNLLIDIGCKLMISKEYKTRYIYMPCHVNDKLVGFTRARIKKKEDYPSFIHASGSWTLNRGLFPFDYAVSLMNRLQSRTMVFVEGQRDALRLLENGIPAMCFFGTNGWTDSKSMLMEIARIDTSLPMLDGDKAGIEALPKIADSMLKYTNVKPIRLWKIRGNPYPSYVRATAEQQSLLKNKLWDPFNCPQWIIDKIKANYY